MVFATRSFHAMQGQPGGSPAEALQQARQAAAGLDVRIGGGPATVRAFLTADLIDRTEAHVLQGLGLARVG